MKLLMHICCAPCTVAIVDNLRNDSDILIEGFFYNPNIHPLEEYKKRKLSVLQFSDEYNFKVNYHDDYKLEYWRISLGKDKDLRCNTCYSIRLNAAAKFAKNNSFDAFTTSLLISPYQNHELIRNMGQAIADKYGIEFYYEDFRELYRRGREISRGKHYYMQKYCGCFYSYSESDHPKKPDYDFES
ncbi:MAG TPA: epoxyqueuosine reductase QueH [Clostridiaceae bacterium]|jgi:predicted adenine nucleotide alpha hydrolase (AANH) superfamily ATPase|nr:epoxyqueuosine reductase QueH [Clostridiaceae bacterium]